MEISLDKWMVMLMLTVISIVLGLTPYVIIRRTRLSLQSGSYTYKLVLTILSCFGAGVLLSTSALHMLPEVRESLSELDEVKQTFDEHFPVAEALMLLGFGLIYLVEEVAHFIMVEGHHHHHHDSIARHNSIAHAIPVPNGRGSMMHSHCEEDDTNTLQAVSVDKLTLDNDGQSSDQCKDEEDADEHHFASSVRSFLALIALSFHAIMEGVAIGIQNSSDMWLLFGAVASHKFVISFCMGMELVTSNAKLQTYIASIVTFAVVSPLGILIGSTLTSTDSRNLPVTIIEGLACGTLLYVVFFEILNRERERKTYSMRNSKAIGFIQFAAIAVGLLAMGCLLTLTEHEHGEETEEDDGHGHEHYQTQEHLYSHPQLGQGGFPGHVATNVVSSAKNVVMKNFPVAFGR